MQLYVQKSVITAIPFDILPPPNVNTDLRATADDLLQVTLSGFHPKSADYLIKSDQRKKLQTCQPQRCLWFRRRHLGRFNFFTKYLIQEFIIFWSFYFNFWNFVYLNIRSFFTHREYFIQKEETKGDVFFVTACRRPLKTDFVIWFN